MNPVHTLEDLGRRADGAVAITVDDGPDPRYTRPILDILDRFDARATFFMCGRSAARHPGLVAEVLDRGHAVGGHTWSHKRLPGVSDRRFHREVDRTQEELGGLAGGPVTMFRPPGGRLDDEVGARLAERGLVTVLWSVNPEDWTRPGSGAIAGRVLRDLEPGAIVLLHDGRGNRSQTVAALPAILEGIRDRELRTVALDR